MTSTDNQDPPLADDMLQAIARMTEIATEQNLSGRREDLSPATGRQRMEQEMAWWNEANKRYTYATDQRTWLTNA